MALAHSALLSGTAKSDGMTAAPGRHPRCPRTDPGNGSISGARAGWTPRAYT